MRQCEKTSRSRRMSIAAATSTVFLIAVTGLTPPAATAEFPGPGSRPRHLWHCENVAPASGLGDVALALDGANNPHVTYCTPDRKYLKHAWLSGASWSIETLERWYGQDMLPPEHCGLRNDIVIDSQDGIHVSFTKYQDPEWAVRYAWYDGAIWWIDTAHRLTINDHTSIAVDSQDYPHLTYTLYQHPDGYRLYHGWTNYEAKFQWYEETLDIPVSYNCIAMDSLDFAHIAYNYDRFETCDLRYTFYDGDTWTTVEVDTTGEAGEYVSLALDVNDLPHISYRGEDAGAACLKYAWHDGLTWQIESPDSDPAYDTSIVLDSSDLPHISYFTSEGLKYAHFDGVVWSVELVDTTQYAGSCTSIDLDGNEFPHIVYGREGYARYAYAAPSVTLSVDASEGGTTDPEPGEYERAEGSSMQVTALPDQCHILDYWELDGFDVGSDNPYEVVMDVNHTLEAFFALLDCDVVPETVEFDSLNVGDSAESTFVLYNCGETNLSGMIAESSDHFRLEPEVLYYDLSPGTSIEVVVYFEPQESGSLSCTIETGNEFCNDVFCNGVGVPTTAAASPGGENLPSALRLEQNHPNPFNPFTEITYAISPGGCPANVTLRIYDPLGRLVRTLVDGPRDAGTHTVVWDGRNNGGKPVASGLYFCHLTWNGKSQTKRMVLLK